jgi:hypothetical protein
MNILGIKNSARGKQSGRIKKTIIQTDLDEPTPNIKTIDPLRINPKSITPKAREIFST